MIISRIAYPAEGHAVLRFQSGSDARRADADVHAGNRRPFSVPPVQQMGFPACVQPVVSCRGILRFISVHRHRAAGIFLAFQRTQGKADRLPGGGCIQAVDAAGIVHVHGVAVNAVGEHQQVCAHGHHLLGEHCLVQRQIGDGGRLPVIVQRAAVNPRQLFHGDHAQRVFQFRHDAALFPAAQQRPLIPRHVAHGVKGTVVCAGTAVEAGELLCPQRMGRNGLQGWVVHARASLRISARSLPV